MPHVLLYHNWIMQIIKHRLRTPAVIHVRIATTLMLKIVVQERKLQMRCQIYRDRSVFYVAVA